MMLTYVLLVTLAVHLCPTNAFFDESDPLITDLGIMEAAGHEEIVNVSASTGYAVAMIYDDRDESFLCFGAVITDQTVICPKSCVNGISASDIMVIGQIDNMKSGPNDNMGSFVPTFLATSSYSEIAILQTFFDSLMTSEDILPNHLIANVLPGKGESLYMIGFGLDESFETAQALKINTGIFKTDPAQTYDPNTFSLRYRGSVTPGWNGLPLVYFLKNRQQFVFAGIYTYTSGDPQMGKYLNFASPVVVQDAIYEFIGECFPSDGQVETPAGTKRMQDLMVGDKVLTADRETGTTFYTDVIGFLDFQKDVSAQFVEIEFEEGSILRLTPDHLLFVNKAAGALASAGAVKGRDVRVGDRVYAQVDGAMKESRVSALRLVTSRGAISPLTEAGTLLVQGTLASSYAYVDAHDFIHAIFAPWRALYSLQQWLAEPSTEPQQGMAPYPRLLKALFGSYVHQYFGNSPAFV